MQSVDDLNGQGTNQANDCEDDQDSDVQDHAITSLP